MPLFDAHVYLTASALTSSHADQASLQNSLSEFGATGAAVISGLAAECDFVAGNQALSEVLNPEVGLYGYAVLSPEYIEDSQQEMRRWLGRPSFVGAAMFGNPGRPVTLEDARDILNAYRRFTKPMAIYAPDSDAVHAARTMAAEFPAMKFLLLGMGGDSWRTAVTVARQRLNIYLEVSGSLDSDKIAHAAEALTPRKLLYGSGSPRGNPSAILGLVNSAPTITHADRDRIRFANAAALFDV